VRSRTVAVVVGHDQVEQGAYSEALGVHEWEWCSILGRQIDDALHGLELNSLLYQRSPGGGYRAQMARLTEGINAVQPEICVELHFNAGITWPGACALHWPGSVRGEEAAAALSAACAHAIGGPDLGAVAQDRSWARSETVEGQLRPAGPELWMLKWTSCPAAIAEVFNGSHAQNARAADKARNNNKLAVALALAIRGLLDGW